MVAVVAGLQQLVAKQCATSSAEHGAQGLVATAGNHIAKHRTDAAAGDRPDDAITAVLLTIGLSSGDRWVQSRAGQQDSGK